MKFHILISEPVKEQRFVWFLGDEFLHETYGEFMEIWNEAIKAGSTQLYLFRQYNLDTFVVPLRGNVRAFLAKVINALGKGLNDPMQVFLPCHIVIVLDKDLMVNAEIDEEGPFTSTIEDCLKWLLININCMIETRKEDSASKRPGSIISVAEPRSVWVQMIRRLELHNIIFSLADKFNRILEDVIAGDKRSHILKLHIEADTTSFDRWGNLTTIGKGKYWKLIDATMRDFDQDTTELKALQRGFNLSGLTLDERRPNHQHNNNRFRWTNLSFRAKRPNHHR